MKYIRKVKLNVLVPFKTISISDANNLKRFFEQIHIDEVLFSSIQKLLQDSTSLDDSQIRSIEKLIRSNILADDQVEIDLTKILQDTFGITDSKTLQAVLNKNDSFSLTDNNKFEFNKGLTDSFGFGDTLEKQSQKLLTDQTALTDFMDRVVVYFRAYDDTVLMVDKIGSKNIAKKIVDSIVLIDSFLVAVNKVQQDSISFTEQVASIFNLIKADTISLTEFIAAENSKLFTSNNLTAGDIGGQSIINTYMDSQYITENYIGTIRNF